MKDHAALYLPLLAACILSNAAHALPLDVSPPEAAFGDADRDGTLLVTDNLRKANFGGGLFLPVRWVYHSSDQATNPYGWDGFSLSLLEAKAIKKTDTLYEVTLLGGKVLYFNKQGTGIIPAWKSNEGEWGGVEEEDAKFTITRWDGWALEFVDGRVRKLVTDDERTLVWTYDTTDPRLVTSVKELGEDPIIEIGISDNPLEMVGSSAVRGAHTITINGDVYTFKYSGGTLRDIEFPDGRKTQWRFENNGSIPGEKRLTLTQETGWWKSWVFYDLDRHLKTDDIWSYAMTGGEPEDDGVVYNRPTMERTRIATGEKQEVQYLAANSIEISTDVLGNITKTSRFKTLGKLYDKTRKVELKRAGEPSFTTIWRGTYDDETGDLVRAFDANDNVTEYSYERFSGASEFLPPKKVITTDPVGGVTTVERDEDGNMVKTITASGVVRKIEWDSRRRLTKIKNADNTQLKRFVYGDTDEILESYDALNNKTEYEYTIHLGDALLTKVTTAEGRITEITRDSKGRMTHLENPAGSEWDYEYVGDWSVVEKVTDPLNQETAYEFDDRLNMTKVTDALSNETETEYDDLDLPKEITDALSQVTKLESNGNGDLKKLTDARNKIYTATWDSIGRRKELKWPDNKEQAVTFDSEGKISTFQPRGTDATITNVWNNAKELTSQSWVNGIYSGTINLTRNAASQVTAASTTAMTLTVSGSFSYNGQGELSGLSQTVGGVTRTAGLTYDLNSAVQTITYPAGFTVEYVRNGDGQVTAIKKGGTTIASYVYDAAGRLSTRTLSNGVVNTYTYETLNRLQSITVTSGTSVLWAERYGYDAAGRRSHTLKDTSGTVGDAYSLDATSQLIGVKYGATGADGGYSSATSPVGVGTWNYDSAGNRETQTVGTGTTNYTVNDVNQYTELGGSVASEPVYTARGDLASNGYWEYSYDAFGSLIQAHNTNSNVLAKYWQDAFGRRAVKDVDGAKTLYFNLGTAQLEAYDVTGGTSSSIIYELGTDRPLAEISNSGTVTFYHQDWLGSIVLLTNSSGAKVQGYTYDAWGKPNGTDASGLPISVTAIVSRLLYGAREFDQEIGFYYYRARAYSPELGRFAQFDPIDFNGGDFNILRFCLNSPTDLVDPFGTIPTGPSGPGATPKPSPPGERPPHIPLPPEPGPNPHNPNPPIPLPTPPDIPIPDPTPGPRPPLPFPPSATPPPIGPLNDPHHSGPGE